MKGEGIKRENGRNPVSAPLNAHMIGLGIVIIERIDTTEIVIGTGTGIEKKKENVVVIELVIVIEDGTVAVTMSVIETETMIGSVIVIAPEKGRGIMKLGTLTLTVAIPVIRNLNMIVLSPSMKGIGMVKRIGIMTTQHQMMIEGGMNNQNMGIGTQVVIGIVIPSIMSTTTIIAGSTIIWMSRGNMTVMSNILIMIVTGTIKGRRNITMNVQHLSHVKERKLEMWTVTIDALRGPFLGSMNTRLEGSEGTPPRIPVCMFFSLFDLKMACFVAAIPRMGFSTLKINQSCIMCA